MFTLRSGRTADTYFDKFLFTSDPDLLREVAGRLAPLVPHDTEVLAGLELGGVPLATALALETGLPAVYVRREPKLDEAGIALRTLFTSAEVPEPERIPDGS